VADAAVQERERRDQRDKHLAARNTAALDIGQKDVLPNHTADTPSKLANNFAPSLGGQGFHNGWGNPFRNELHRTIGKYDMHSAVVR